MKRLIIATVVLLICSIKFKSVNGWRDINDFVKTADCKVLGKGSFGVVEEVFDTRNKQKCAKKHMDPRHPTTALELKVAIHIQQKSREPCPYIVQMLAYDVGSSDVQTVMELADGGELLALIVDHQRLPEPLVKLFTIQLVLAIGCMHDRGILWLDGKPENTLLILNEDGEQSGRLKIADFGVSEIVKRSDPFTTSGAGTTFYISPEVHAGKERGYASDWWTLGIMVYEMLTGRVPFIKEHSNGSDFVDNLIRYYRGERDEKGKSYLKFPDHITEGPKDLVIKLLDRYPARRFGVLNDGYKSNGNGILKHPWFQKGSFKTETGKTMSVLEAVEDHNFDFSKFVKQQLTKGPIIRHLTQAQYGDYKEDREKMQARLAKQAEDRLWKYQEELLGDDAEMKKIDPEKLRQIKKAEEELLKSNKSQPGAKGVNSADPRDPTNLGYIAKKGPGGRVPQAGAPGLPNARRGNGGYGGAPPAGGVPYGQPPIVNVQNQRRKLTPEEQRQADWDFEQAQMKREREAQDRLRGRLNGRRPAPY
ncbi:protein kinase domain-containing protein [Ditylenchus destructor]|uniref:Protein kinase domain-containing protein n=1 Tax=Ditylenchus destructor TaxID=166010 RepID=A0AAD4MLN2_9BILA|nr:protein kinase domain-containing protein [Ditylenchus destructor]